MVAQAVERCMTDCGLEDAGLYRQLLETSPEEWEELVEEVVIPETWFFRDWEPFVFLGDYVTSEWLPRCGGRVFRVLSVPCSSGEEPYSIAMTLLDRGFTGKMFQVDAADISRKALERCRRAVYDRNSFRGEEVLEFQDRYFQETPDGRRLLPEVCRHVQFVQANLLEGRLPGSEHSYDAIFCRNLMIYFDDAARERTIDVLRRLVKNDGLLFAGYAEAMIMLQSGFAAVDHPRAFAYREGRSPLRHARPARSHGKHARKKALGAGRPSRTSPAGASSKPIRAVRRPTPDAANLAGKPDVRARAGEPDRDDTKPNPVEQARCLADEGRLEEAVAICNATIEQKNAPAECYCLLGLIHEASGERDEAEGCFDKALYLQPDCEEALVHLSLILEFRGDTARADALRDRVRRGEQTSPTKTE